MDSITDVVLVCLWLLFLELTAYSYLHIAFHEFGHYFIAKAVGGRPFCIRVGSEERWFAFKIGRRAYVEIGRVPVGGSLRCPKLSVNKLSALQLAGISAGGFLGELTLFSLMAGATYLSWHEPWLRYTFAGYLAFKVFHLLIALTPDAKDGRMFWAQIARMRGAETTRFSDIK